MEERRDRTDTRDKNQSHDTKGEAQNVNIDPEAKGQLGGTGKSKEQATQKATEGIRQGREDDPDGS